MHEYVRLPIDIFRDHCHARIGASQERVGYPDRAISAGVHWSRIRDQRRGLEAFSKRDREYREWVESPQRGATIV
jgi:hypothetical protein